MAMVSDYNPLEMETVQRQFPKELWTAAYAILRNTPTIEHAAIYRKGSRGKGSKLYWKRDLSKVADAIERELSNRQTELPSDALDFEAIAARWNVQPHVASMLFGYLALEPCGKYYPNGQSRSRNVFNTQRVAYVFYALERLKADLSKDELPDRAALASMLSSLDIKP